MREVKIIKDPKVHQFTSTSEAYDAVNCEVCFETGEKVSDGDVLVIASEGIIGVATSAWPCAVVLDEDGGHGQLHTLAPDADISKLGASPEHRTVYHVDGKECEYVIEADPGTDYRASWDLAFDTAVSDADITGNDHWRHADRRTGA